MLKTCLICNSEFKAHRSSQKTCSKKCMGVMRSGSNNSNFGKHWTDEQRLAQSNLKKTQFAENPEYVKEVGKSNRGVKFSPERIKSMHGHRSSDSYSHYHSVETKEKIGQKSKEKWTREFKETHRKLMEEAGHWISLSDKDPYALYYKEANWINSMVEFLTVEEKEKLFEFGIFGKKNTKGWVRDHIVSRMVGYEFGLPPYLLRHPANLQFISHANNIKKGFCDRRLTKLEKEYTIKELLNRIEEFNLEWNEHSKCIEFIRNKNENMDNQ